MGGVCAAGGSSRPSDRAARPPLPTPFPLEFESSLTGD